ncbi:MAG: hypothetical protein KY462_14730 [Actinobacteria bacterium]|nr:hypothetical protein [Actinomycetota bacterium]
MTETPTTDVEVALPADVHQIDETGDIWSVLEEASDPDRIAEARVIVAGDPDEPFLARVIDIVDGADGTHIVHLEVIGLPGQVIDELTRAKLLSA